MAVDDSWLFGPKSVEKIRKLNAKVRSNLLADWNGRRVGDASYSPWLCLDLDAPFEPPRIESKYISDSAFLGALKESIEKTEDNPLRETFASASFRIFSEISEVYPSGTEIFQSSYLLMKMATNWLSLTAHELIDVVIPIRPKDESYTTSRASFSSHDALGALFLSMPVEGVDKRISLALSFAHEIGHQVLMVYQRFDSIISSDLRAPVYSGTRDTARPAIMAMHSAVAISYMLITCENIVINELESSEEERKISMQLCRDLRSRLEKNVRSLLSEAIFTQVGRKMITEMAHLCEPESVKGF